MKHAAEPGVFRKSLINVRDLEKRHLLLLPPVQLGKTYGRVVLAHLAVRARGSTIAAFVKSKIESAHHPHRKLLTAHYDGSSFTRREAFCRMEAEHHGNLTEKARGVAEAGVETRRPIDDNRHTCPT